MIPLDEIKEHTDSCPETFVEKANNETNRQIRKRLILMCSWIAIWVLVCIPSNIIAIIFYLKQKNVVSPAVDGILSMYIDSNATNRIDEDEIQNIQLNYSTNAIEKVCRK